MIIPDKRKQFWDNEAYALVGSIETSSFAPLTRIEYVSEEDGSVIDLSGKFVGPLKSNEKSNSVIISEKSCEGDTCRELRGEGYQRYIKLVDSVVKTAEVSRLVSRKFIEQCAFDYIIETHKNQCAAIGFSDHMLNKVEGAVANYKIYFSVDNLEIFPPTTIGKATLALPERDILVEDATKNDKNSVELFFKKYGSKLFISHTVRAEKGKAVELAFVECSLSIDVLKICCDTMDDPLSKISFDIDSRIAENSHSQTLVRNVDQTNDLTFKDYRIPNFHVVTADYRRRLNARNLEFFSSFVSHLPEERSELQNLIVNAIRRFAKALTTVNLNLRIVELFTIMESLIVPNSQANILDSLTKYASKLVYSNRVERQQLIALIKSMYGLRSAYVHHAKEPEINVEQLRQLQVAVQSLIGRLIEKSRTHTLKESILKEIDDAILDAY